MATRAVCHLMRRTTREQHLAAFYYCLVGFAPADLRIVVRCRASCGVARCEGFKGSPLDSESRKLVVLGAASKLNMLSRPPAMASKEPWMRSPLSQLSSINRVMELWSVTV